jgi:MarR family transcriptional regulator, transcriptional regulator for hemolysin
MFPPRTPYILRHSLGALVHDVARLRRKHLDHALRPLGLTRAQRWLLIQLSQFEEGVSQTVLAESMKTGLVSLGEKLALLEALGYIERARSPVDRRQKLVRLTDAGYDALKRSTRISEAFNAEVLGGVDPDRVAAAEEVLAAMRARLTAMDEVGAGDVSDCTEPRPANDEA